jgi:hypothetical protein
MLIGLRLLFSAFFHPKITAAYLAQYQHISTITNYTNIILMKTAKQHIHFLFFLNHLHFFTSAQRITKMSIIKKSPQLYLMQNFVNVAYYINSFLLLFFMGAFIIFCHLR